ncbi:MAG TPA: hypothetical protein DD473_02375 [Planctomycetaceae bacterium]|nr:hypothetical protein [Planctomycetaceae bacterium]
MSAIKKIMSSGATASLVLSFLLPVPNTFNALSCAEAGVRPKFSKPWLSNKPYNDSNEKVKSYPLPDFNDPDSQPIPSNEPYSAPAEQTRPATPPSSVMQELNHLYEKDGKKAPDLSPYAFETKRTETARTEAPISSQKIPSKPPSIFSRFISKLTGKSSSQNSNDPASYPEFSRENAAKLGIKLEEPQYVDSRNATAIEEVTVSNDLLLPPPPVSDVAPAPAVVSIPKTAPVKTAKSPAPAPAQATKTAQIDLLPPLPPPMPGKVSTPAEAVASKNTVSDLDLLLPPLPGSVNIPAMTASPETEKPILVQTPSLNEVDESAPQPLQVPAPKALDPQVVETEVMEPTPQQTARVEPMPLPVETPVEVAVETPVREEPQVLESTEIAQIPELPEQPPLKGEMKSNLPLAPSASLVERKVDLPGRVTVSDEGWRSRDGQPQRPVIAAVPEVPAETTVSVEPNQLTIPDSARPAQISTAAAEPRSPQEKYQLIASRGDATGFKGFCPVVLRDTLELVDANPVFRTEYEDQLYYFSSEDALQKFEANPLQYVPAHGGVDIVQFIEHGLEQPGRLDFAVWYQERLFLFSSQSTLEIFRADPERFVD